MLQKIIKIGSSLAVTIPKHSLKELDFKAGDTINVSINTKKRQMIVEPESSTLNETVAWTDKFIEKYRDALISLKDK
jgi:putative addiction module antidote